MAKIDAKTRRWRRRVRGRISTHFEFVGRQLRTSNQQSAAECLERAANEAAVNARQIVFPLIDAGWLSEACSNSSARLASTPCKSALSASTLGETFSKKVR